jgi:hypothetical protein
MEIEENLTNARQRRGDAGTISSDTLNRIAITVGVALVAFLLGFASMWITSKGYENVRDSLMRTLRPSVLQNGLATAALNAQRGEFEQARQKASDFFTNLRAEVDKPESSFGAEQREALEAILSQRDETITLLARGDPAAASRLSELYFSFMKSKNSVTPIKK